jgi:AcrR family transcriptional regulator
MNIVQDMSEKKSTAGKARGRPKLDDTRKKVLEAARKRIVAGGLAELSARGLAKDAGCSVGTLYNVFGDLDGVIREVNIGTVRQLEWTLAAALKEAPEGAGQTARLTLMASAYLDFAMDHTGLWNALFEFRPKDKTDQRLAEMREALFHKMMEQGGHGTEPATDQDRVALRMLWGAVHGVVSLSVNRFIPDADRETARDYVKLVVSSGVEGYRTLLRTGRA